MWISEPFLCLKKEKSKKRKIERENRFSAISATLKSKNYTKLVVPTLKQIKRFLKKEKSLSNDEISSITEENVIEKWGDMCEYNDWEVSNFIFLLNP